ncbi:MAG: phosphotransferase [Actinomycetes bacterium]
MSTVQHPDVATAITPAWINEHCRLGGTVVAVEAETIGEGVGLMAALARLRLTYADGETGPASVIAKLPAAIEQSRQVATMFGFYEREVSFYREAAPTIDNVANAHFADIDDTGSSFVIVMDDLSHCRTPDQVAGCSPQDAAAIIDAAADLHARYWANEALDGLTWLPRVDNERYIGAIPSYVGMRPAFEAGRYQQLSEVGRRVADRIAESSERMMLDFADRPELTMAHYDLRLDNILFHDDAPAGRPPVYILDWQLSVKTLGAFDVAYFLGWSMTDEVRRQLTEPLMRRYHDRLTGNGVTGYSYQRFEDDVRRSMIGVAFMGAYASVAVPVANERGEQLVDAYVFRSFRALEEMDAQEFVA